MRPRYFPSPAAYRGWLAANHDRAAELWVGFYNEKSPRAGITYQEALDQALCFGWIDGIRKSVDHTRYTIRFTPRKPVSRWSAVNVRHVRRLLAEGRMRPPGLAAFERRGGDPAGYSYEGRPQRLDRASQQRFRKKPRAWTFFQAQAPWYRRTATFWVMSAKRPETRERRLATLMRHSANQERIPPLARPGGK